MPDDSISQDAASRAALEEALSFGIGARITLSVMSSDYVSIILSALKQVDTTGLDISTGDVSTYIAGTDSSILRYLTDLSSHIASTSTHSSISIHLFRGCPGSTAPSIPIPHHPLPVGRKTDQYVNAEWALYPLSDDGNTDHMKDIYAAIDHAKARGVWKGSERSVTRLEGDLGVILESVVRGWVGVGGSVRHVTSHLTVSVNSPSHAGKDAGA